MFFSLPVIFPRPSIYVFESDKIVLQFARLHKKPRITWHTLNINLIFKASETSELQFSNYKYTTAFTKTNLYNLDQTRNTSILVTTIQSSFTNAVSHTMIHRDHLLYHKNISSVLMISRYLAVSHYKSLNGSL